MSKEERIRAMHALIVKEGTWWAAQEIVRWQKLYDMAKAPLPREISCRCCNGTGMNRDAPTELEEL